MRIRREALAKEQRKRLPVVVLIESGEGGRRGGGGGGARFGIKRKWNPRAWLWAPLNCPLLYWFCRLPSRHDSFW